MLSLHNKVQHKMQRTGKTVSVEKNGFETITICNRTNGMWNLKRVRISYYVP